VNPISAVAERRLRWCRYCDAVLVEVYRHDRDHLEPATWAELERRIGGGTRLVRAVRSLARHGLVRVDEAGALHPVDVGEQVVVSRLQAHRRLERFLADAGRPLTELQTGQDGRVVLVRDDRPELLATLARIGLVPEVVVTLTTRADDGLRVRVGDEEHHLPVGIAERVYVRTDDTALIGDPDEPSAG
jgi:Fe2+ transport system protein FeoA